MPAAAAVHPVVRRCRGALLLAALPLLAAVAHAQGEAPAAARTVTLAGIVRDTADRPLSGAEVWVGDAHATMSGEDGTFQLAGIPADTLVLRVRRIGYRPAEVLLAADAGVRVELAVRLVPAAVELGTIVVEGRAMDTRLWQSGFYDRQKMGRGTYFGPEFLARHGGSMSGLLREVPSVTVVRDARNRATALGRSTMGSCPLNVFIDGTLARWAGDEGLDFLVDRRDVLAIEVYPRITQLPSSFAGYAGASALTSGLPSPGAAALQGVGAVDCGALVIWTRPM